MNSIHARLLAGFFCCALSGCTAQSLNQGTRTAEVRAQLPTAATWAHSLWAEAIPGGTASPPAAEQGDTLTADGAVRLAFGENPRARLLRADFLGEMSAIDAGAAPGGVGLSWARLRPDAGLAKLALALSVPLEDWLTLPSRQRQAFWDRAASAQRAAFETLRFEHEVRVAWVKAVGESRRAAELATAAEVAGLAAELGERYHVAGNIPLRERHALEQQAGESLAAAAAATVDAEAARAALATMLGLPTADARLKLPAELPSLPVLPEADESERRALVAQALQQRLDLRAARSDSLARLVEADRARLWSRLPTLRAGAERERETDGGWLHGPVLDGEWSPARLAEAGLASAAVMSAAAKAESLAIEVANDVQLRRLAYRRSREMSLLQAEQVQARQAARVQDTQRRQNFMLEGPFTLLEERRHLAEVTASTVERQHAAWVAWLELQLTLGGAP